MKTRRFAPYFMASFTGVAACAAWSCSNDPVKVEVRPNQGDFLTGDGFVTGDGTGGSGTGSSNTPLLDSACVVNSAAAEQRKVALYVMLDSSGSMEEVTGNGSTKWQSVSRAMRYFMGEARNTELSLGLQFFPLLKEGSSFVCRRNEDCGTRGGPCFLKTCKTGGTITLCTSNADCPGGAAVNPCVDFGLCENSDPDAPLACVLPSNCANGLGRCQDFERTCTNATECDAGRYGTPAVEIGLIDKNLDAINKALDLQPPQGLTPTAPALLGAVNHAREWATAHPEQTVVTLLATDGLPTQCGADDTVTPPIDQVLEIARAAATADQPVRTFVIGVFQPGDGASINNVNAIAAAGGTDKALFIDTSGSVDDQFLEALRDISSGTLACEFQIPQSDSVLDYFKVNMQFETGGVREQLPYVNDEAGCAGAVDGWHYDVDPSTSKPSLIRVCPDVCEKLKATTSGTISFQLGCKTIIQ